MNNKGKGFHREIAACGLIFTLSSTAMAVERRVDPNSPGNGPGTTWSNAYNNLTDALAAASANDEIWVADGTYKPANQAASRGFPLAEVPLVFASSTR